MPRKARVLLLTGLAAAITTATATRWSAVKGFLDRRLERGAAESPNGGDREQAPPAALSPEGTAPPPAGEKGSEETAAEADIEASAGSETPPEESPAES
jgi:hypothetical protein